MSPLTIDQRQLQTLGQLISAGGHHDVPGMLQSSLERLVAFWPAQAGALVYHTPHGEAVRLEHGTLDAEATRLIVEAREAFARRDERIEPHGAITPTGKLGRTEQPGRDLR